jgi:mannose-1-phosphate guanylyltransferase
LPIVNRPHIDHVLDLLQRHGVDDVILTTSYLAEAFEGTVRSARERGLTVEVTHEEEPLGTAGAIRHAAPLLRDETFLAFNADVLTDVDLGRLIELHRDRGARTTVLLTPVDDPSAFGVVPTDDDGLVEGFIEKPPVGEAPTNLINAGVYVMEPEILKRVPEGEAWSAERQLFPELADADEMYAFHLDAYWMDIGTPQKYLQANLDALGGAYRSDVTERLTEGGALLGRDVSVGDGASIITSSVGDDADIGAGARMEGCVLLPGAIVGEGATLSGCILGAGANVDGGTALSGITIGDGDSIGGQEEL